MITPAASLIQITQIHLFPIFIPMLLALDFIEHSFEYSTSKYFKLKCFLFMAFNTAVLFFINLLQPTC